MSWRRWGYPRDPEPLTEFEVQGFIAAAESRPKYKPKTHARLRKMLHTRNPWRWRRLQSDFKWAQKQLAKAGLDPEEIRWLL